ncbi:MAG: hypothetical protein V2I67_08155 [Thermoanaerobaculales bacterium]|nr:hypothetical protein [Thermoanaerobaculales bacterium]
MWRLTTLVVLAAAATAVGGAASDLPAEAVAIYDDRVTFTLPDGWTEIPPGNLEELTMRVAEATGGRSAEYYQHGYYPPTFADDPWLPHVLVQIRESGRLPYGRFLGFDTGALDDEGPDGLPPLILDVAVDRLKFDTERMCLRLEHTLDLRFKGRVRILTASFLTERGVVAFHFADRERRIDESRPIFDNLVAGVTLAPEIAYRPRLTDRWPGLYFFAAAALMAVLLILTILRQRRRP